MEDINKAANALSVIHNMDGTTSEPLSDLFFGFIYATNRNR